MKRIDTIDFVEKTDRVDGIDLSVPTLIVGKELAVSICGSENIHVLNKKIKENLYWTYSKFEKRNEFEKDIEAFNSLIIDKLSHSVKYTFINIFYEPLSRIKRIISFIKNGNKKLFYFTKNHVYLYYNGYVFGFSLDQTRYIGISDEKIKTMVSLNVNNTILCNDKFVSNVIKRYIPYCDVLIPYLHFLKYN